jgi:hypothetical protein
MSILIEGPDRCGKTTVSHALQRLLPGWSYKHHGVPPSGCSVYQYHGWGLVDAHAQQIIDRLHWSEVAYGMTYRRECGYQFWQWRAIELALLSRATTVLHLTDEPGSILSRWKNEPNDCTKISELTGRFNDIAANRSAWVSALPRETARLSDLIQDGQPTDRLTSIASQARASSVYTARQFPASIGTGSLRPEFLVLGEAPSGRPLNGDPGFALACGPSCEWFWRAMDDAGIPWWRGYYTNASAFEDECEFERFVRDLEPNVVLTLGARAYRLAARASTGANIQYVEHPSFVRRFKHNQYDAWSAAIKQAITGHRPWPWPGETN